ncbi:aminoglycoside phosphotransferase family protein [Cellulomonas sp. KRMCY2]|uniref:aminoglycoside phosphotransferase family protein n=1 Tax=Cellulomonas sp. KRMCY2 TaxID=1304865 RepID=UPI001E3EC414|nr:aminoglycoside phosphotransferase family protein [Cellulomonas sp. KRMCY2]
MPDTPCDPLAAAGWGTMAGEEVAMTGTTMHDDERDIDAGLVRRLLAAQLPQWAGLPLTPVRSAGTDNAMFRLGDDMAVRLPRVPWAVEQVAKEQTWLPRLAPLLPLAVPELLGTGAPGAGYDWPWSVYRWLDGVDATVEPVADLHRAADELGGFVAALRRVDPTGGPPPGEHNSGRGVPLAARDTATRAAITSLVGMIDTDAATAAWEAALRAPVWDGPPAWIHGDLHAANLLVRQGELSAVIDFGCLGVGDPAGDVSAAWVFCSAGTRDTFRAAAQPDDAMWARGRGWALSPALIALPYYRTSNPVLAGIARRAIDEVLADREHAAG